jgi:hypothetical protein
MSDRKALIALRDAVKAGRWWDDVGIAGSALRKAGIDGVFASVATRAFHGSLDAAKALHEAVLTDEWLWVVVQRGLRDGKPSAMVCRVVNDSVHERESFETFADNPARAWLLAILEALIAETPE